MEMADRGTGMAPMVLNTDSVNCRQTLSVYLVIVVEPAARISESD